MKRTYYLVWFAAIVLSCNYALGFNYKPTETAGKPTKPVGQQKGAACAPANYRKTMSFNDVSAQLETGGLLFMDRANNLGTYKVPKTGNVTAIFAASLWMGGTDVNGQLKLAAVKFRGEGNDFWPGPLSAAGGGNYDHYVPQGPDSRKDFGDANIDQDQCLLYDNIFTVTKAGVTTYVAYWECINSTNPSEDCEDAVAPSNVVLAQVYAWPGNGDPTRGQDVFLAPFYDRDQDGAYEPGLAVGEGDYPWYDDILGRDYVECGSDRRVTLFGDETHWWVFNDKGNIHTETGGDPIGMEIRAQAFSFATDDEINKMTFYNYELINRSTQTLYDTYFSQYVDADLGYAQDDYAGCDVTRGLGYVYNGDLNDEASQNGGGYGQNPPAIGVDFFEGPYQDADGVDNPLITSGVNKTQAALAAGGIVYPGLGIGYGDGVADNERFGMRSFSIYSGNAPESQSDPTSAVQFYNYMQGLWRFGDELHYGGTGFPGAPFTTDDQTLYMFPADSDSLNWSTPGTDPGFDWSEFEPTGQGSSSNPPGDRRFVQSAGPFTLRPGAVNNITVGIVFGQGQGGGVFSSVNALKVADTKAQALFDNCFRILDPPNAPVLTIQELGNELILMLDNPANSNNSNEDYEREDFNIVDPADGSVVYDDKYRFEGYQIYQMADGELTVGDLDNPTKARLVAQCDVKNGVDRLINFEFNESLGFSIPSEKVNGADKGIQHTFRITEDQFATGSRTLVNQKNYYYLAVAYAYNNYKTYNPTDPLALDGQKKPYLRSRLNADGTPLLPLSAYPHFAAPELGGTDILANYGDAPMITRLDGRGNGGNVLELSPASELEIIQNGFMETPEYAANKGPIQVKVVDPLNVVGGYFECLFTNYTQNNGIDTARWMINRYDRKDGELLGTVQSDRTITFGNEQIIPEWGISVSIEQKFVPQPGLGNASDRITTTLPSGVIYKDSTKKWLDFVNDNASFTPFNWIRSGNYIPDQVTECDVHVGLPYLNPCCYRDDVGKDPYEEFDQLIGGGVAPHKLTGYRCDFMPLAIPTGYNAYGSARTNASLRYLPSVDIVLTDDTSKWTRCVVIELGRDANLNQGNGNPGELREHVSVNKLGSNDNSGTSGMGWFPGYAIDLETGARLHMAFGENSFLGGNNGADMIWNPTATKIDENGTPVFGGQHPIYVYGVNINNEGCPYYDGVNTWVYDQYQIATTTSYKKVFTSLMWIANTVLAENHQLYETDARFQLRVLKQYENFVGNNINAGKPAYSWNMDGLKTGKQDAEVLASALDLIGVVPNPYYAFSEYERNRLDTRVKITHLPDQCTITIYNVSGKLVRQFKKDNPITYVDWDLKNSVGIPISSGVYLIHVEVPGAAEPILKFFGGMRQIDLENI